MPMVNQPEDLGRVLADFERRIRTLETAQRLTKASITDDAGNELVRFDRTGIRIFDATGVLHSLLDTLGIRVFDDAGVQRAFLGNLDGAGNFGVEVRDPAGGVRFRGDNDGLRDPYLALAPFDLTDFKPITAAAFVDVGYYFQAENISHIGLYVWMQAAGDAATTGEIRIKNVTSGAVTTAHAVPAGAATQKQFRWLHGATLGTGPVVFAVQARRTGGAGNVNVYHPASVALTAGGLCTAGGV